MMYLPLAMLFYRLGKMKMARNFLKELAAVNLDTEEFFERGVRGDLPKRAPGRYAGSFAIGTMEEFGEAVTDNAFAFVGMDAFFAWGLSELRQCRDEQCTWGCAPIIPGLLQCRHSDLFWRNRCRGASFRRADAVVAKGEEITQKRQVLIADLECLGRRGHIAVSLRCTRYRGDRYADAYWLYCSGIIGNNG